MAPDWDVLAQMHEIQNQLQQRIPNLKSCQHVKGHQDTKKESELKWPENLNVLADKLATAALKNYTEEDDNVWHPLPACKAYLICNDHVCTSKIIKTLEHRMNELPMHDYLKQRNNWNDDVLYSIDWDAFKLARKNYQIKHFHICHEDVLQMAPHEPSFSEILCSSQRFLHALQCR